MIRWQRNLFLGIIGMVLIFTVEITLPLFVTHSSNRGTLLDDFHHRDTDRNDYMTVLYDSFDVSSFGSGIKGVNSHNSRCLFSNVKANLFVYLMVLQNSVRIISLPSSLSSEISGRCERLGPVKRAIASHPHSIELHFPRTLRTMAESIRSSGLLMMPGGFKFNPLWQLENSQRPPDIQSEEDSIRTLLSDPLFYYVEALPYHVIYCTKKKNNKEDWTGRDPYWKDVADFLLSVTATTADRNKNQHSLYTPRSDLLLNSGLDFLIPASHPQSGPSKIHPSSLSYLQRGTFLKTDFDISGSDPKDIIVPYYTIDSDQPHSVEDSHWCQSVIAEVSYTPVNRSTLLFFAGSDNPKDGYRSGFLQELNAMQDISGRIPISDGGDSGNGNGRGGNLLRGGESQQRGGEGAKPAADIYEDILEGEVFFSLTASSLSASQYQGKLLTSKYCLILRGDTTSSKRLFSSIAAGCVPVIISDGLRLPNSNIIDYSSFTLTFPESIVYNTRALLTHLKEVSSSQYADMRCALSEAKKYLIFGHKSILPDGRKQRSSINPVTLVLIDALMRRETACLAMSETALSVSTMCQRLLLRVKAAKRTITLA